MTQPPLFPHLPPRAVRGRTRPPRRRPPVVAPTAAQAYAAALARDVALRRTGRAREVAFRDALLDFATAHAEALPPTLYEAIMDHLTRTDADGHSLCLAGPLREALLAEVRQWCERWQVPLTLPAASE